MSGTILCLCRASQAVLEMGQAAVTILQEKPSIINYHLKNNLGTQPRRKKTANVGIVGYPTLLTIWKVWPDFI